MYKMKPLPYSYDYLEPYLTDEVITIHYNDHHKKYLENLNKILNEINYDFKYNLEEIPKNISSFPILKRGEILYNVGGVLNHDLYWLSMGNKSNPKGKLMEKITVEYGSFDNFKQKFNEKVSKLIGSGYTFLVANKNGDLNIINLENQETPLTYDFVPLFAIDLWEHAYYLQYKSKKDKYIKSFWEIANFDYATSKYETI